MRVRKHTNETFRRIPRGVVSLVPPFGRSEESVARSQGPVAHLHENGSQAESEPANQDWPVYGGNPENTHYSSLAQINRDNVKQLRVAWTFDTGEPGGLETSPLIVDGVLFGITPTQKIFALDAATGKQRWEFDSGVRGTQPNRGLAYWSSGEDKRILVAVMNFVYALDPATGKPIPGFGEKGRIDLRENLGRDPKSQWTPLTSPGIVYQDLLIVGARNPETLPAPPGDIRAYDVRTGKLRWSFHTIPHPGEFGYDTWPKNAWKYSGAANNWAGMALDRERGIVYVPTGSAAFDFYGANRTGRRPVRQLPDRARRRHRQANLAFSGRAPRFVGPRFSRAARAGHRETRRQNRGRGRADHEARVRLSIRPRQRRAAVSDRISQGPRRAMCREKSRRPSSRFRRSPRRLRGSF